MSAPVQPTVWRVTASGAPTLSRHCPRCDAQRDFVSSERFRVNANGKRIDVWLVYLCPRCERSHNEAIFERSRAVPERERYEANDAALARRWALKFGELNTFELTLVTTGDPGLHRFEVPEPLDIRTDRVLARALDCSRAVVARRVQRAVARRRLSDGLVVALAPH